MKMRIQYGVDAPDVVRVFLVASALLALPALIDLACLRSPPVPVSWSIGAALLAVLLLGWTASMFWSSMVGKLHVRDRLIAAIALSGHERVLDAGCGRGLALIGCARKLTTGRAIGIDLWAGHLSHNNFAATRANVISEGVDDRVDIETGDITCLPFADATFDAVISMTVIHNIVTREGRDRAVAEIVRVLKPGGRIAIFDLMHTSRYMEILRQAGLRVESLGWNFLWFVPCRSLLARKPQ